MQKKIPSKSSPLLPEISMGAWPLTIDCDLDPGQCWARVNTWNVSSTMSVCVSFGGLIFTVSQKKTPGEGLKYIPRMEKSPAAEGAGGNLDLNLGQGWVMGQYMKWQPNNECMCIIWGLDCHCFSKENTRRRAKIHTRLGKVTSGIRGRRHIWNVLMQYVNWPLYFLYLFHMTLMNL